MGDCYANCLLLHLDSSSLMFTTSCHGTHHSRTRIAADTTHAAQHKHSHTPHTQTSHFAVWSHATTRLQRLGSCVPHFNPPSSRSLVGLSRFCELMKAAAAAAAAGNEEEPSWRRSGGKAKLKCHFVFRTTSVCVRVCARACLAE